MRTWAKNTKCQRASDPLQQQIVFHIPASRALAQYARPTIIEDATF
jgi:hypothetical protein